MNDGPSLTAQREPEVPEWISKLERELTELQELAISLRSRINSVLHGDCPLPSNPAEEKALQPLCPTASEIRNLSNTTLSVISTLVDISNRLEI